MKNLLLLLFLFTVGTNNAQEHFNWHFYPSTSQFSNDAAFSVEYVNPPSPISYIIHAFDMTFSGYDTIFAGDSLTNIPSGTIAISAYVINPNGDTIGSGAVATTFLNGTGNYIQFNQIQQSLSNNSCDGYASIYHGFDTTLYTSASFDYVLSRTGLYGGPLLESIPVTNLNFNNLCPGYYRIESNSNEFVGTTFVIDAITYAAPTFDVDVYSSTATVGLCNSTSFAQVFGGQSPYQYSWNGGTYSSIDSINNLCTGLNLLTVIDANNDTSSTNFGVTDSTNSYINNNNYGPVVDTFAFDTQNCSFDYNQPVDSMFISNTYFIDSNSMYYELEIWQNGSPTIAIDTISYVYGLTGTGLVSLTFYCEVKSDGLGHIVSFTDYLLIGESTSTGIKNSTKNLVLIYPNPNSGLLNIKSENNFSADVFDVKGKLIFKTSETQTDISFLQAGIYFVKVKNLINNQTSIEKIIVK